MGANLGMDMKIVAIIPIKMNNERLPGKNTKLLGNSPLIEYVQRLLLNTETIEERYVFCSNLAIKKYLLPGIKYLQRDISLDLPTSNFTQIFDSFSQAVDADIYIYAHATAPYITLDTLADCIKQVKTGGFDSAFCVEKIQDYFWQDGEPLNFDAKNMPRSQDLKPIYRETSGVYVFKKEVFQKYRRRIGIHPYLKEVSYKEAVDINTKDDFHLAEILLNKKI